MVMLEKVMFVWMVWEMVNGVRVWARATSFGAEGVDACSGGVGGVRWLYRFMGFGVFGLNLIERCE